MDAAIVSNFIVVDTDYPGAPDPLIGDARDGDRTARKSEPTDPPLPNACHPW